jgi:iron complex outermembrane receptor protein
LNQKGKVMQCERYENAKCRIGAVRLVASLVTAVVASGGASTVAAQNDIQELDAVVVSGSGNQSVDLVGSTVIEVIDAQKLEKTGADDLNSALDKLLPSFRWPQTANSGNSSGDVKSVTLRGVGPTYTLVLVNGKRRHAAAQLSNRSGFSSAQRVDINQIPINAIERIEVLRDGTSTRYGGDAVAGAINIILKANTSGGQVSSRFGQTSRGDGASRWVGGTVSNALGNSGGFLTLSFDALNKDPINRAGPNANQVLDGKPWNLKRDKWGDSDIENGHVVINGEVPLTESLHAYTTGTLGKSRSVSVSRPVRYWAASNDINRFPEGHQPKFRSETEDYELSVGLRWEDARLGHFDFSLGYGYNRLKEYTDETASVSWGAESQSNFYRGSYTNVETPINLDWEKGFDVGIAKPLELSAGAAWRKERWKSGLGDLQSWQQGPIKTTLDPRTGASRPTPNGNPELWGIMPEDITSISRHINGLYFGADAQITEAFNFGGVARWEEYSDVGSVATAQLAVRYDFTPSVALRGALGTGFKAPSIAHVGSTAGELDTVTGNGDRRLRPDDPRARALGATELKPSKSDNASIGLVLRPTERSSLTIDAYQIKIRDQIVSSASLSGPEVLALLAASGDTATTSVTFYTNGVDSTTRGIDIAGKWRPALPTGYGNLSLTLGYSYTRSKVNKLSQSSVLARTLVNEGVIRNFEETQPRSKLVLSADYLYHDWHLSATALRYGKSTYYRNPSAQLPEPTNVLTYDPAWILNLRLGYDISDKWSVALGANNVFDQMPEKTPFPNSGLDQYGHTPAYGSAGTQYFVTLDFKF